jgi:hypothetical protein
MAGGCIEVQDTAGRFVSEMTSAWPQRVFGFSWFFRVALSFASGYSKKMRFAGRCTRDSRLKPDAPMPQTSCSVSCLQEAFADGLVHRGVP